MEQKEYSFAIGDTHLFPIIHAMIQKDDKLIFKGNNDKDVFHANDTKTYVSAPAYSGGRKKKSMKATHTRTKRTHVCKDGVKRTVYAKNGKDYVMRKSKVTGAVRFEKI